MTLILHYQLDNNNTVLEILQLVHNIIYKAISVLTVIEILNKFKTERQEKQTNLDIQTT